MNLARFTSKRAVKTRVSLSVAIILISLLYSCSPYSKHISSWYTHYYNVGELNNQEEKWKSEYYFYNQKGTVVLEKNIGYGSSVTNIEVSSGYVYPSLTDFSIGWEKLKAPYDLNGNLRNGNLYKLENKNDSKTSKYEDESLGFYYYTGDTVNNLSVTLKYQDLGAKISESEISIWKDSDTLEYYRTLEVSQEVAEYFREYAFLYADSIELMTYPPLPDLSSCKLIKSKYYITKNVSSKSGNRKETTIDSTYVNGSYRIKKSEEFYFLYEEKKSSGIRTFKMYTSRYYKEFHHLPNEVSPYYALEYSLAPNGKDTTFKYEMTTTTGWRLNRYKYVVTGGLSERLDSNDLRLPIVKRELYFWINPRKQSIVRKRYIAFTSQDHRLELDWLYRGYKTKTNINTIPEVSGNLKYDLIPDKPRQPMYPFFNSMSNQKPRNRRERHQNKTNKIVKHFRGETLELEKDRESGYEKRVTPDSTIIYEFFYLRK